MRELLHGRAREGMKRLFTGPIFLNGDFHRAAVIEGRKVIALDDNAMNLNLTPEPVEFLTHSFRDAHLHPVLAGRDQIGLDVTECASVEQVLETVSNWLKTHPGEDLVVGGAYNRNLVSDGLFEASWLDSVTGDRPLALHATDRHTLWVNTAALNLIEISEMVTHGVDPRGMLRESDAKNLVLRHEPKHDDIEAFLTAQETLLKLGITQITDAWVDDSIFETYEKLAAAGQLKLDVELTLAVEPGTWREDIASFKRKLDAQLPGCRVIGAKFFIDGVFGGATAAVHEPYETTGTKGDLMWNRTEIVAALRSVSTLGLLPHLHAIGDRAIDEAISCLKESGSAKGATIVHLELASTEALEQMAELGIIANIQPLWGRRDGMLESCSSHLGQRIERLYPTRTAMDAGVEVVFGSDWPVSSSDPLLGIYTAVTRQTEDAKSIPLGPEQSITIAEAFANYASRNGFALFNANPFESDLREVRVIETL